MSNKVLRMCIALSCCFAAIQTQKVSVTVYYESLGSNDRKFFNSQLHPTLMSNLGEWVNLTLVPYGLANEALVEGQSTFTCSRGAFECLGNKIHACAINNIAPNSNTEDGFNNITVNAINCLMVNVNETIVDGETRYFFPTEYCSTLDHVPDYVKSIENCVHHTQGNTYLSAMGSLTRALQPTLKLVPTITFDGQDKSQAAQEDFKNALCASLKVNEKPAECNGKISAIPSVPTITYDGQNKSQAAQEDSKIALCASLTVDECRMPKHVECKCNASTLVVSTLTLVIVLFKQFF